MDISEKLNNIEREHMPSRVTKILLEQGYSMDEILSMKEEWEQSEESKQFIARLNKVFENAQSRLQEAVMS